MPHNPASIIRSLYDAHVAEHKPHWLGSNGHSRFGRSKQVVSYLGLNPREHSSGGRPTGLEPSLRGGFAIIVGSSCRPHGHS
jgi:hypothetical protein